LSTIQTIIDQHAEEAAFCWLLRDSAVNAPNYNLAELTELDDRVEAHLDGLTIAGQAGWEACCEQLSYEEPGEVFVAAMLALPGNDKDRWETVFEAALVEPATARGLVSALGWMAYQQAAPHIQSLLASEDPQRKRIGLVGSVAHSKHPGPSLMTALTHDNAPLRARALLAIGQLGATELVPHLAANLDHQDQACRFAAAWSGSLLGHVGALSVLKHLTLGDQEELALKAAKLMGRALPQNEAIALFHKLAGNPNQGRRALLMAGSIGDPVLLPFVLEKMAQPHLARCAGEAFSFMTGVDIEYQDFEAEEPEDFEAGPTEDPEDEDIDLDPDEDLPWPDPSLIQQWMATHGSAFKSGVKYLSGMPLSEKDTLGRVLKSGIQTFRAAAALELKLANRDAPLFEVRAPGKTQQAVP